MELVEHDLDIVPLINTRPISMQSARNSVTSALFKDFHHSKLLQMAKRNSTLLDDSPPPRSPIKERNTIVEAKRLESKSILKEYDKVELKVEPAKEQKQLMLNVRN